MSAEFANGSGFLLGATEPLQYPPIIGRVRARITRPLNAPATITGRFGRAWQCDLEAIRRRAQSVARDAMLAHWIVEAPWSHEVVHSYSLILIHLRFMPDKAPVEKYLEGASHEVHLHAIRPDVERVDMLRYPVDPRCWLAPPVFAAQLVESGDDAALSRVRRAIELVCEGRVSPHPAHARAWVELFGDNMLRHAAAPPNG